MATAKKAEPTRYPAKVVTAGAAQIKRLKGKAVGVKREKWQDDSWDVYDQIGEVKQGSNFMGDVCAGARLYIAVRPVDDKTDPTVATSADTGYAEAADVLDRMRVGSTDGGLEGLVRESVINLKMAGEFFVIAEPEQAPNPTGRTADERMGKPERWSVYSVSEVQVKGQYVEIVEVPGARPRRVAVPEEGADATAETDAFVLRVWQKHPRYGGLADCMMRALLLESDELLLLSRAIRGAARSRIATAGIMEVASEYSFASQSASEGGADEDPESDPFMERFGLAVTESIEDESHPDSVTPIVVRAPADVMAKAPIKHTFISRPADATQSEQRTELLKRLGNSLDIPFEQVTGMGASNHWCVDDETEALTHDGWKRGADVAPGDMVLTLNHATGIAEWQPVRDMYRAEVVDEPMIRMEGMGHSSVTTPNHRWPVVRDRQQDHIVVASREVRHTRDLSYADRITTGAPVGDLPTVAKYDDALVELVAWFWTEGSIVGHGAVSIAQSHTRNPERVARIRAALSACFGAGWTEHVQRNESSYGGPVTVFRLPRPLAAPLLDAAPAKRPTSEFVRTLTAAQLRLFTDVSEMGDGQHHRSGRSDIWQRRHVDLAAYELALILQGRMVTWTEDMDGHRVTAWPQTTVRPVKAADAPTTTPKAMSVDDVAYTGTVWCPVTGNGTWLARRRGTVYYTGNTAWQIDSASWGRYGQATMRIICQAWTTGILWPYLDAAGVEPEAASRLMIWFDPANAIVDPDEGKTADELFDRGGISWEAYRQRKGANEDEAPTEDELALRSALGLLKGGGNMGGAPLAQNAPNDGEPAAAAAAMTAARPRPALGRRLWEIDQRLRTQLAEIAEGGLTKALERAGARVRTASRRNDSLRASLADVPALQVAAHCGPGAVAAVGLTDDALLAGPIEGLEQRVDARIRTAQASTRRELRRRFDMNDRDEEELQQRQDTERHHAVAWFLSALTTVARDRLYDPTPGAPAHGEHDVSTGVPSSLIREVMARAGGGSAGLDEASGGVATGVDVMGIWAANGVTLSGYEWAYGDSGSRSTPFPGHEDLDGVEFAGWDDPALTVRDEDSWLDRDFYQPGDHDGCQCSFIPLGSDDAEEPAAD